MEENLDADEEYCPVCGATNLVGSADECEHFVGVYHGEGLIWGDGEALSSRWSDIVSRLEELKDGGVKGVAVAATLPPALALECEEPFDLVDVHVARILGLFGSCHNGREVSLQGFTDSERTSLYCEDPAAVRRALRLFQSCLTSLDKLTPPES